MIVFSSRGPPSSSTLQSQLGVLLLAGHTYGRYQQENYSCSNVTLTDASVTGQVL